MDAEKLMLEIAARDLTGEALQAVVRNIGQIRAAAVDASRATGELGGGGAAQVDKLGNALGGVAKIAAGVFAGIKLADLVNDMADFHAATMQNVAGLGSLADRFGITTDQLQAYQSAARLANVTSDELNKTLATFNLNTGKAANGSKEQIAAFERLGIKILDVHGNLRPMPDLLNEASRALLLVENASQRAAIGAALLGDKGARLTPLLRELAEPVGNLVDRGKAFGEIVDRELINKLDRSKNAAEAAKQQFTALYATVAAPIHAQGMEYLAGLTSDLTRRIREAKGSWIDMLGTMMGGHGTNATMGGLRLSTPAELGQDELKRLRGLLANVETKRAAETNSYAQERLDIRANDLKVKIAALEATDRSYAKETENTAARQYLLNDGLPAKDGFATGGKSNTKPNKTGGEARDRIGEAISQLRGETAAAAAALETLRGDAATPLDKLEREVELRKRIADEIAKLGKYDPKDARVAQIAGLVREHASLESSIQQTKKAMQDATEIEQRAGNGTLFLRTEQIRLNEALATGRLTTETYAASMKAATDQAELMRLKLAGQAGGVEGLVAGMQYAAKQQAMNNTAFVQGQRVYEQTIDGMTAAFTKWRKTGQADMGEFLLSWVDMIIQMQLRASAMQAWSAISGGMSGGGGMVGGLIASIFGQSGGYTLAGNTSGQSIPGLGNLGIPGMYAEGGRPQRGLPSIVGERGPEWFVPDTAGRVVPMGDDEGGGTTVNQYWTFTGGVTERDLQRMLPQIVEASVSQVEDRRSRGGSMARTFRR